MYQLKKIPYYNEFTFDLCRISDRKRVLCNTENFKIQKADRCKNNRLNPFFCFSPFISPQIIHIWKNDKKTTTNLVYSEHGVIRFRPFDFFFAKLSTKKVPKIFHIYKLYFFHNKYILHP